MLLTIQDLVAKARPSVRTITAVEAARFLAANNRVLLIDVRETEEHEAGAIEGAINIPRGILEMNIMVKTEDPDRPIFVHCAIGGRAILAAKSLQDMGYADVSAITAKYDELALVIAAHVKE